MDDSFVEIVTADECFCDVIDRLAERRNVTLPQIHYADADAKGSRWGALTRRLGRDVAAAEIHLAPITSIYDRADLWGEAASSPSSDDIARADSFNKFRRVVWPIFEALISGDLIAQGRRVSEEDGELRTIQCVFWQRREWMVSRDGVVKALQVGRDRETASDEEWSAIWWDVHLRRPGTATEVMPSTKSMARPVHVPTLTTIDQIRPYLLKAFETNQGAQKARDAWAHDVDKIVKKDGKTSSSRNIVREIFDKAKQEKDANYTTRLKPVGRSKKIVIASVAE